MIEKKGKIMFQGTASNVGKSIISTGICRILSEEGYSVIPFKSQNMSLQSKFDSCGGEMGTAQIIQAEACGVEPFAYMNPILLKPCGNHISELIFNGASMGKFSSKEYQKMKDSLSVKLKEIYQEVEKKCNVVVLEGAGSPVELNINSIDLSNMEMAKISDSPVVLIADIDKGGVFASIVGTLTLLGENKDRVKGIIINKFRGKKEYFKAGIEIIEEITKLPVIGVVPFLEINLEEEDGASGKDLNKYAKTRQEREIEFKKLSSHLREHLDMDKLQKIIFG